MTELRILHVEDHALFHEGVARILKESYPRLELVHAATGAEGLDHLLKGKWDMVLLDLSIAGRDGLDFLSQLRTVYPDLPVLVLSMHCEAYFAVRSMKLGAAGYLTKDRCSTELIAAVEAVLSRQKYITEALAQRLASYVGPSDGSVPHESLSDREFQVLRMLASGRTVKEIGVELSLSMKTISTYRTRIREKMGLRTNHEIVSYCVMHGLLGIE